ncbi:hypothetical protein RND81_13G103100 [Saponaria officinalis]|uniref:Uncharacterized protein n=1 Tax=Saponaria officinalis TaxID=3572 RepID=A0AAW1GW55_SAPOF
MQKKASIELDSYINKLHDQIATAISSMCPAARQLAMKLHPSVTESMHIYLKQMMDGERRESRFRNYTLEMADEERNDQEMVDEKQNDDEQKKAEETKDVEDIKQKKAETKDSVDDKGLWSRARLLPRTESLLKLMEGSIFLKILKGERSTVKTFPLIIFQIMKSYDKEKEAFLIGGKWCVLCEHEVAFLLGIKAEGEEGEDAEEKSKSKVIPEFLIEIATSCDVDITAGGKMPNRSTLESLLEKVKITDENEVSVKKLIYFYLLNFVIFPTSNYYSRHMFFSYDGNTLEEKNWAKPILKRVLSDCSKKKRVEL